MYAIPDNNDPSANNPFTSDVSDLSDDYMDYSNLSCYTQFTPGQYSRMQFFLTTTRNSLLNCLSCSSPCPNPVTVQITLPISISNVVTGSSVNFAGNVTNATSYQWYLTPGLVLSNNLTTTHVFNSPGTYWMKFRALSTNPSLCLDGLDSIQITVIQPAITSCAGSLEFNGNNDALHFPSNVQYYSSNGFYLGVLVQINRPVW
jgi:hypothetical protein